MIRDKGGREGWRVSIHMAAAKGKAVAVNFLRRGVKMDTVDSSTEALRCTGPPAPARSTQWKC